MADFKKLARSIVEFFDDILDDHGLKIPSPDRTGEEGEAAIHGSSFEYMVNAVAEIIAEDLPASDTEEPQETVSIYMPASDKEGICPVCGANINYGCFELVDEGGVYEFECPRCGATGKEGYDLIFDGSHYEVKLADGRPFKEEK